MSYESKNIIVGAAAVFTSVSASSDEPETGFYIPSAPAPVAPDVAGQVAAKIPSATANQSLRDAAMALPLKWRHLGFTTNGVELSYEPDFGEVTVDQSLDSPKMFKQGQKASVKTTLSEATLENLLLAWGQANSTLTVGAADAVDVLGISSGDLGDEPVERSILFVGLAPRKAGKKRERAYLLRRCLNVESSSHSLQRTDATTIPVSFRALPDLLAPKGQEYGKIVDRTISTVFPAA